jgi:hypothetical protein
VKKTLMFVLGIAVAVGVVKLLAPRIGGTDWQERLQKMPDDFPPKMLFNNIKAIREDTDRILKKLSIEPNVPLASAS